MINDRLSREADIAAITIGLVLFFGAISLGLGYIANRSGLLVDASALRPWIASATIN
jgi:hypothetical protein